MHFSEEEGFEAMNVIRTQWKGGKKVGQSLKIWKLVEEAFLEMTSKVEE